MIDTLNPLRWLIAELPAYVAPERLSELMTRLDEQKRQYTRKTKIHELERRIATTARFPPTPANTRRLARWRATVARLKEEAAQ
jgi:hypothetical protein